MTADDRPCRRYVAARVGDLAPGLPACQLRRQLENANRAVELFAAMHRAAVGRRDRLLLEVAQD